MPVGTVGIACASFAQDVVHSGVSISGRQREPRAAAVSPMRLRARATLRWFSALPGSAAASRRSMSSFSE